MVAQIELVEAPPTRRIQVPGGHTAVWGVDPGSQRVAVSAVRAVSRPAGVGVDRWVGLCPFGGSAGLGRLARIYEAVRLFTATALQREFPYPGLVWVERPGGKARNYPLDYAVGVTVAAMDRAIYDATGRRAVFEETLPMVWKKLACGRGDLFKPDPKKGRTAEYPVLLWAQRELGYSGGSYDEADALGIAEAGRRTVALVER